MKRVLWTALTACAISMSSPVHAQAPSIIQPFGHGYIETSPGHAPTIIQPFGHGYIETTPGQPNADTIIQPFGHGYSIWQPNANQVPEDDVTPEDNDGGGTGDE